MPTIKTRDGTELYFKDWGSGRPVVLIHGWPLSADSWDPVALKLAEAGYRAIAYDRRGFGRSDQPWNGYDYDSLADDLADVLQETGATADATLVGFSMGGGEVARYMSRHGGKGVRSAALVSSVVPYMPQGDDNPDGVPVEQLDAIAKSIGEDRAKFFGGFFKQFYGVGLIASPVSEEVRNASWNVAMTASLKATLACAQSFGFTDFRPDLAAFTVPTLVIHGSGDTIVPHQIGKRAAAGISNAQYVEYDGEPHGLFASATDRLVKDLLTFLSGTPAQAERETEIIA
ncbi:alpha/beta hydrolase [Sphingomonas sp. KR3-1]|uniref:alpha/beta fold hydrolase n=1 Tax=Sphingomonas sp. KR3-1 TaxID=3156611 RepID=UPI0032B4A5CE